MILAQGHYASNAFLTKISCATGLVLLNILKSFTDAQSLADYPNNVPGSCASSTDFDCGNGKCINFNLVRNCVNDCGNNADEQCGQSQILCDVLIGSGCGKCVSNQTANSDCLDRRYSRLCDEGIAGQPDLPIYKCVNTPNCVLLKWLNDGADDCGDFSDEDPCLQGFNCNLKTSPSNTQFTLCTCKGQYKSNGTVWARPDPLLASIPGHCTSKPLQFDCGGGTCIDISKFRDCVPDCPNGSDEACWLGTTMCMDGCTCVPPASPTAPTCPAATATIRTLLTSPPTTASTAPPAVTSAPTTVTQSTSTSRVTSSTGAPTTITTASTTTVRTTATAAASTTASRATAANPITSANTSTTVSRALVTSAASAGAIVATSATCGPSQYRCVNGQCISEMFVSDKQDDCSDRSDEVYCGRYLNCSGCAYSFNSHAWICGCPAVRDGICYPASLPSECADMTTSNARPVSGVYSVMKPNCANSDVNQCITQVRCDFDTPGGPWLVIQRRLTGTENFTRNWQDYKQGFGNRETGDFWQGNDYVSALTSRQGLVYDLLILVNSTAGQLVRSGYSGFSVTPETQNYTLTLGRLTEGDDNMAGSRSREFGTIDHDTGGCASRQQAGWWFTQACDSNGDLNAPLKSVQWPGPNRPATVRTTMMMIRAVSGTNSTATTAPAITIPTTQAGPRVPRTPGQSGVAKPSLALHVLAAVMFVLLVKGIVKVIGHFEGML